MNVFETCNHVDVLIKKLYNTFNMENMFLRIPFDKIIFKQMCTHKSNKNVLTHYL